MQHTCELFCFLNIVAMAWCSLLLRHKGRNGKRERKGMLGDTLVNQIWTQNATTPKQTDVILFII